MRTAINNIYQIIKQIDDLAKHRLSILDKIDFAHTGIDKETSWEIESKLLDSHKALYEAIDLFRNYTNDIYEEK